MNVPKNILFRMNMDSEEELVEHVTVDGCNETDSLCEMEKSLELTGTRSTASLPGTATSNYERDVDIEELLLDTPEPTNHEVTTQDSVEDLTNKWDSKELQNSILIEEKETLEKVSEMEEKKELLSKLKEQIRTMLGLILEKLETRKIYYDEVENLPWCQPEIKAQMVRCEKESIEQEYEIWKELRKTLNDDWKRDNKIMEEYMEDFEEADLEVVKECKRLENYLKTKKEKLLEASTAYFRKAGLNI